MPPTIAQQIPETDTVEECARRSRELLLRNATPAGLLASTPSPRAHSRQYTSLFARDIGICTLGACAAGDPELTDQAAAGLRSLARFQAPNGQIPKLVKPESGEADFWYTGCIDATLWWLIAVDCWDRHRPKDGLRRELEGAVGEALRWLACQEHPAWGLLQQNEASDWADIMPRSGFVLYTNALWYWVKRRYELPGAVTTRDFANALFHPFGNLVPSHRRARLLVHYIRNRATPDETLLSFVNFSFWGEEIDVFGNLLAALTGLVDGSRASRIVHRLTVLGVAAPFPVRSVGVPIERESPLWRRYMQRHQQNYPFQYHNGGCWPMLGGFWVALLAQLGQKQRAGRELAALARANRLGEWEFNEWLHGMNGTPQGMPGQSWNAAVFLLARQAVTEGARLCP